MTHNLTFHEKLLPTTSSNSEFFDGEPGDLLGALYDTITTASGISSPSVELQLELSERHTIEEMASNPVSLRFLQLLIAMVGARRVLEIGAFIGLSTIYMAKALPSGGEVVSIEKFDEFAAICRKNFALNGVDNRIRLIVGDAFDILPSLPRQSSFDLIFIDGNKERYRDYFLAVEPLLAPGGMIVVDDVFFHGDAMNAAPRTTKGAGVKAFLEAAAGATGYRRLLLPIGNGMMLMLKPR